MTTSDNRPQSDLSSGRADAASVAEAREQVAATRSVVALTGAGISAESGVPTFRGPGGMWRSHRPEDLATPEAFARDPQLVWEWYDMRRQRVAAAEPNAGHRALVALEASGREVTVATQNVDGLHRRAGSRRVLELHGSLWTLRCTGCRREREDRTAPLPVLPPRCATCGALERPGVVWFGEALPIREFEEAMEAVQHADVLLVVGTSSLVYPAAGLAELALEAGIAVIEVNPDPTPLSAAATLSLRGTAGAILPLLVPAGPEGAAQDSG